MRARAEVRRAGRRAEAKLNHQSYDAEASVMVEEPKVPITAGQRFARRAGAVLLTLAVLVVGGTLLILTATSGGKGYQVAPVLALMVGVLFGFPAAAVLGQHIRSVWSETA